MSDESSEFEKYHTSDGHWFMGLPLHVGDVLTMGTAETGMDGLTTLLRLLEKRVLLSDSDYTVRSFNELTMPELNDMLHALLYAKPGRPRQCSDPTCVCYADHRTWRERVLTLRHRPLGRIEE